MSADVADRRARGTLAPPPGIDVGAVDADGRTTPLALAAVAWQRAVQGARLMVGVPDYDAYVAHLRDVHPDVRPLTRDDFLRAAQDRRYGRGTSRCC